MMNCANIKEFFLGCEDRFYNYDLTIGWVYYNPDSFSGGQFVINRLWKEIVEDAIKDSLNNLGKIDSEFVFERLSCFCSQTCVDKGDIAYESFKTECCERRPDFIGTTTETLKKICEHFGVVY